MEKIKRRVVLNLDYCIGCQSCAAACGVRYYNQTNLAHGYIDEKAFLPLHCRHCELPACVETCPTKALIKTQDRDGLVVRRKFLCVGCRSCSLACPFGIITSGLKYHIPMKCDLCLDRLEEGKVPRCVATCTSGALSFEEITETSKEEKFPMVSTEMTAHFPFKRR